MTTITIAIAVYLLSFFILYFWIRNAHSKGGVCENIELKFLDLFITLCPMLNTTSCIILIIMISFNGRKRDINFTNFLNRFFNIKN